MISDETLQKVEGKATFGSVALQVKVVHYTMLSLSDVQIYIYRSQALKLQT